MHRTYNWPHSRCHCHKKMPLSFLLFTAEHKLLYTNYILINRKSTFSRSIPIRNIGKKNIFSPQSKSILLPQLPLGTFKVSYDNRTPSLSCCPLLVGLSRNQPNPCSSPPKSAIFSLSYLNSGPIHYKPANVLDSHILFKVIINIILI